MHPYAMHAPPLGYQPLLTTTQQEIEHSLNSLQLKLQQVPPFRLSAECCIQPRQREHQNSC